MPMDLGFGTPITLNKGVGGNLLSLFASGENGFLFYPMSDLDRLRLLPTIFVTKVAANDDPVGVDLENHAWGAGVSYNSMLAARPEGLSNASLSGGTTGVIGSGGVVPTDWSMTVGTTGLATREIVGHGTDATYGPYEDIRFAGTPSASSQVFFNTGANRPAAVAGETWRTAAYFAVVAGSMPGVLQLQSQGLTSGGAFVETSAYTVTLNGSTPVFAEIIRQITGGTVAFAHWLLSVNVTSGVPVDFTLRIYSPSLKKLPGNHALQATTTKRPLWKANSGKPNLTFDGTDDFIASNYIPGATGTVAIAFRTSTLSCYALGGGTTTGNKRLRIGLTGTGLARATFNDASDINLSAVDRRGSDVIVVITWDATGYQAWLDGALAASAATVPNLDGTGSGYTLGALEAGTSNFMSGAVYAALARSIRSTPAEIALISNQFRNTFQ